MINLTRRSVIHGSAAVAAVSLARPYVANAAATTAEMWFAQGFAKQEDESLLRLVADYQKVTGNKIDLSIIPFAPLRQKEVSAITSGVVPDIMGVADLELDVRRGRSRIRADSGDMHEYFRAGLARKHRDALSGFHVDRVKCGFPAFDVKTDGVHDGPGVGEGFRY
jgi:hypothetical protein